MDQIEARAMAVARAEYEALMKLSALFRELAVELPRESDLPVRCANASKTAALFARGKLQAVGIDGSLRDLGMNPLYGHIEDE